MYLDIISEHAKRHNLDTFGHNLKNNYQMNRNKVSLESTEEA